MTELEICNWALLKMGQNPLSSLEDEDSPYSSSCKALLSPSHSSLLNLFDWRFATFRDDLAPLKQGKDHQRWAIVPKRFMRAIEPRGLKVFNGLFPIPNGMRIFTLTYIKEVDYLSTPPLYQEALACKIAVEMCVRVRESENFKQKEILRLL